MAKVDKNILLRHLTGSLGKQIYLREGKGGQTIMGILTERDNRKSSELQKVHQSRFKEASVYAKDSQAEPIYHALAEGTPKTSYNVAIADWFHEPEIVDMDLSGWNGRVGEIIRVKAVDDVKVTKVTLVITDEEGVILEQGEAEPADGLWWAYTTKAEATGKPQVVAAAMDLPGHIAEAIREK